MIWAYLIVFNERLGTRKDVQEFLDTLPEVTYWYSCMPNCVFLTSSLSAGEIADSIRANFGTEAGQRFLVVEVHDDRQGWLPKKAWHIFRNPQNPRPEE